MSNQERSLSGLQEIMLDAFRLVAALFVLIGHSFSFYQISIFRNQDSFPYLQNVAVVMFFLLSGFLTAFSLEKKNTYHQYSFTKFFVYKTTRIFAEYFPGLCIIAVIDYISILINEGQYNYYQAYNIKQFVGNVLMLQNMGPNGFFNNPFIPFGTGRPLWTLAIEYWFYMLFGIIYLHIANKERITLSKVLLLTLVIFMCVDYIITGRGNGLGFVFALGVMAYYYLPLFERKTSIIVFLFAIPLYIVYGIHFKEAYSVYSFIILWVIFCSLLGIGSMNASMRRNPILSFLSKSSFMLYLIHYSIIELIRSSNLTCSNPIKFYLGVFMSLGLSLIAFYIFGEQQLLKKIISKCYCVFRTKLDTRSGK